MSTSRERLLSDQLRSLYVLFVMTLPCLVAFFAFWLPMFRSAAPEQGGERYVVSGDRWTLLGVAIHPGEGDLQTPIRVLASLTLLMLVACVYAAVASTRGVVRRPSRFLPWTAGAALVSALLLIGLVAQDDGVGTFGTDTVQPLGAAWLLVIVPVWFLVAADAARRM